MLEKADLILFLFVAAIMPNHDLLNLNLNFLEVGYMFIGREAELKFLEDKYEADDGQLIVLYGRRRVGKTETLKLNDISQKSLIGDWKVEILVEDYNLYKLGFADTIPCLLSIDVSKEEISELRDELIVMECSVYSCEELLYKNPSDMSEKEKTEYRELKKDEEEYLKYAPLEAIYDYWLK